MYFWISEHDFLADAFILPWGIGIQIVFALFFIATSPTQFRLPAWILTFAPFAGFWLWAKNSAENLPVWLFIVLIAIECLVASLLYLAVKKPTPGKKAYLVGLAAIPANYIAMQLIYFLVIRRFGAIVFS